MLEHATRHRCSSAVHRYLFFCNAGGQETHRGAQCQPSAPFAFNHTCGPPNLYSAGIPPRSFFRYVLHAVELSGPRAPQYGGVLGACAVRTTGM